jgi:hypothetical protein
MQGERSSPIESQASINIPRQQPVDLRFLLLRVGKEVGDSSTIPKRTLHDVHDVLVGVNREVGVSTADRFLL